MPKVKAFHVDVEYQHNGAVLNDGDTVYAVDKKQAAKFALSKYRKADKARVTDAEEMAEE